jgi:hypothetical protein
MKRDIPNLNRNVAAARARLAIIAAVLAAFLFQAQAEAGLIFLRRPVQRRNVYSRPVRRTPARPAQPQPLVSPFAPAPAGPVQTAAGGPVIPVRRWVVVPQRKASPEKIEAERQKVQANTIAWQKVRAEAGSESAMLAMGRRYIKGDGVPQDAALGKGYLKKAADLGFSPAERELKQVEEAEKAAANEAARDADSVPAAAASEPVQ